MMRHFLTEKYPGRSGRYACVFLFLASLGILPVAGCFFARACALDDSVLVGENPLVNGAWPWWKAFTTRYYFQYTPVTFLVQRLNALLFGLDAAWSFRLISWLIHVSSAFVLWRTLSRLGVGRRGSLFAAGAWAVHPMACESVAWIAERSNALAFFFGAVALWAYVKWHGRWQGVVWAVLAFAAALLSKPLALGWLPVFIALEVLGGPRRLAGGFSPGIAGILSARNEDGAPRQLAGGPSSDVEEGRLPPRWWMAGLRLLPLFALAMALMFVGLNSYETADRPPPGGTWFTALLTDTGLFLRYVWNTLVPVGLSAMYAVRDIVSLSDVRLWLNLLVWLVLVGGSVALAGSRRRAIFGWLWFFGALGPACNVIAIGYPMQDRYAYLASAGLLLVVAEVAAGLSRLIPGKAKATEATVKAGPLMAYAGPVLCALYIAFLAVLSLQRAPLWGDNLALMRQAMERQPEGVLPHVFYGKELEWQAREIERSTDIYPPEARAFRRSAAEHFEEGQGKPDAYVYDPFPAVILLARNWALSGKHREAIELLKSSMPDPAQCRIISKYGLRHMLVREERFGFSYTVPLLTLAEGHYWLGEAHLAWACEVTPDPSIRLLDRVHQEAREALAINPAFYEAYALISKEYILRAALQEDTSSAGCAVGRGRLAVVIPQLDKMGREKQILKAFAPPVPDTRMPALGCLAMARAARKAAESGTGADGQALLRESLSWARRACELDPGFSECVWFRADTLRLILKNMPAGRREKAHPLKTECIRLLESIAPNAPRGNEAQLLLQSLKAEAPSR